YVGNFSVRRKAHENDVFESIYKLQKKKLPGNKPFRFRINNPHLSFKESMEPDTTFRYVPLFDFSFSV
ncbi:9408_t:CDS:1, partial [Funneliformis geosporum]